MTVRSIPRYPEVREDGSMWVPVAPPPVPKFIRLLGARRGNVGRKAVVSYSTEWVLDLRVLVEHYEPTSGAGWETLLCTEAAWHEYERHARYPGPNECVVAAAALVYLQDD